MEDNDLKPTQPWGPDGPTIWVGEPDPVTSRVPVSFPSNHAKPAGSFLSDEPARFTREKNA